jgi:hypothetical protein
MMRTKKMQLENVVGARSAIELNVNRRRQF